MTFAQRVEILLAIGFPVTPVLPKTKRPFKDDWQKTATLDRDVIAQWNLENPNYNSGAMGRFDIGLIFDVDSIEIYEQLKRDGIDLGAIRTFKAAGAKASPCGHYYFLHTARSRELGNASLEVWSRSTGKKARTAFDLRANNGIVVGPGSIHPSGKEYEIVDASPPILIPDALVDWIEQHKDVIWEGEGTSGPDTETTAGNGSAKNRQGGMRERIRKILRECRGKRYDEIKVILATYGYSHRHEVDSALANCLFLQFGDDLEKIAAEFAKWKLHQDRDAAYDRVTLRKSGEWYARNKRKRPWAQMLIRYQTKWGPGPAKPIVANVVIALRNADEWRGKLAFNTFFQRIETLGELPISHDLITNWEDYHDILVTDWMQHNQLDVGKGVTADAVLTVAHDRPFNPLQDYLKGLRWKGTPRVDEWLTTYFGVASTPYSKAVGRRWLISGVARALHPGTKADCILVFEGAQGDRKSMGVETLVPNEEWWTDRLSDLDSKDSVLDMAGKWIIEVSEMNRIRGKAIEAVKSFVSRRVDKIRVPYGRRSTEFPRTCILAGTTNGSLELYDETGGRRFWPVEVGKIDVDGLRRDRDQLWAEALHLYRAREKWWLETTDLEALAIAEQEDRYEPGPWDDIILEWVQNPRKATYADKNGIIIDIEAPLNSEKEKVTITDILVHAVCMAIDKHNHGNAYQTVAKCLRHAKWKPTKQDRSRSATRGLRFWEPTD